MIESKGYYRVISISSLVGFLLLCPFITNGQFIDLQLEVEPRIDARTEQHLDFGTLQSNTGRNMISLGDPGMGMFSITSLENQMFLVSFDLPEVLRHVNPTVSDIVQVQLFARYGFSAENPQNSFLLTDGYDTVIAEGNNEIGPWSKIYLFIFGSVDITNVSDGIYSDEIVLYVEYI